MKIKICAIGICKDQNLSQIMQDYAKRIRPAVELSELKHSDQAAESQALFAKSEGYTRILLDQRGAAYSSEEFADFISKTYNNNSQNSKGIAFLIGGAEGHTPKLRCDVALQISLGKMTLPHMLARVVLLEQIYRAQCISQNHPYHK